MINTLSIVEAVVIRTELLAYTQREVPPIWARSENTSKEKFSGQGRSGEAKMALLVRKALTTIQKNGYRQTRLTKMAVA